MRRLVFPVLLALLMLPLLPGALAAINPPPQPMDIRDCLYDRRFPYVPPDLFPPPAVPPPKPEVPPGPPLFEAEIIPLELCPNGVTFR